MTSALPKETLESLSVPLLDAKTEIDRALTAWRDEQVMAAIACAESYLAEAKKILRPKGTIR